MTASDPLAEQTEVNDKKGFILDLRMKEGYVEQLKHIYRQTLKRKMRYIFLYNPSGLSNITLLGQSRNKCA